MESNKVIYTTRKPPMDYIWLYRAMRGNIGDNIVSNVQKNTNVDVDRYWMDR